MTACKIAASLATALVLAVSPATAAEPVPGLGIDDGESVIEELVVTARYPGPAFWRVKDEDSEVWILGVPNTTQKRFYWDRTRLETVLTGANVLLLQPTVAISPARAIGFLIANRKQFNYQDGRTLGDVLPTPVGTRLVELNRTYRGDVGLSSTLKPAFAGLSLMADYFKTVDLDGDAIDKQVRAMARKAKIKSRHVADYPGLPLIKAAIRMDDAGQTFCLEDMLNEIGGGSERVLAVTSAWADGNVGEVVALERRTGLSRCIASFPEGAAITRQAYIDEAAAIRTALNQPGKTVMLTSVRSLVSRGGILEQLQAQGLTVRTPDQ
jgi:uncharacterized protein YbaP (TraB family)